MTCPFCGAAPRSDETEREIGEADFAVCPRCASVLAVRNGELDFLQPADVPRLTADPAACWAIAMEQRRVLEKVRAAARMN